VQKDRDTQQQQLHAQINQLTQAKDEQVKLSTERQAQLEQVRRDKDKQRQQLQAQIDQLTQARDAQAKQKAQRDSQLEQARQACQTLEASQKETEEENELLLLQLHQVQEELETIFLRNQNLKQAHQQLEASQIEAARANEVLVQELQQVNQALGAKDGEIEKQRQRVTRLKQTVSWKVTAPLRVMAKPFNASIKEQKKAQKQIELLKSSGHFDAAWYLAENEDVAKMSADPVEHYISHGAAEGRNPSPAFNTQRYLEINPDVAETGINPLVHFVKYGMAEGRAVSNGA
jgi:chromosome segregation ATPase